MKPVFVTVTFSESNLLKSGTQYNADEFERLAYEVAKETKLGGAKTDIVVTFDNNSQFEMPLCIGRNSLDRGLLAKLSSMKNYYEANQQHFTSEQRLKYSFLAKVDLSDYDVELLESGLTAHINEEKRLKEEAEKKAYQEKIKARELARIQLNEFRSTLNVPNEAKAVIVAYFTSMCPTSDPYSDYYASKTDKVIILAWSKHTRDLFSELRKAALNHEDTAYLAAKDNGVEHREKYSMGRGYYLTDKEYIRYGLEIRKITFRDDDKARSIPFGEIAIPNYEPVSDTEAEPVESDIALTCQMRQIEKTVHSVEGHRLFVANPVEKLNKNEFKKLIEMAKKNNGYYSKYNRDGAIAGFQFKSLKDVELFCKSVGSDFIPPKETKEQQEVAVEPISESAFLKTLISRKKDQELKLKAYREYVSSVRVMDSQTREESEVSVAQLLELSSLFLFDSMIMESNSIKIKCHSMLISVSLHNDISLTVH